MAQTSQPQTDKYIYWPKQNDGAPTMKAPNPDFAVALAQRLARICQDSLTDHGLIHRGGGVVTAGGYWRDMAFGNKPKDIDIFILDEHVMGGQYVAAAEQCAAAMGLNPIQPARVLKSYGTWAPDLNVIVKLDMPDDQPDLDVVFIQTDAFVRWGSECRGITVPMFNTAPMPIVSDFIFDRFDLRLNVIGASADRCYLSPQWHHDAENELLVVQHARLQEDYPGAELMDSRIAARVERLITTKFNGWRWGYEGPLGDVKIGVPTNG